MKILLKFTNCNWWVCLFWFISTATTEKKNTHKNHHLSTGVSSL